MKRWSKLLALLSRRRSVPDLPNELLSIIFSKMDYLALAKYV